MSEIRSQPCSACPYRRDVASGVWAAHEYDKLVDYDRPTGEQPFESFACHATPEHLCHGWAVVHTSRGHEFDLLALRMHGVRVVPLPAVPLWSSGAEAAEHGKRDLAAPSVEAERTMGKLLRKYDRLRTVDEGEG